MFLSKYAGEVQYLFVCALLGPFVTNGSSNSGCASLTLALSELYSLDSSCPTVCIGHNHCCYSSILLHHPPLTHTTNVSLIFSIICMYVMVWIRCCRRQCCCILIFVLTPPFAKPVVICVLPTSTRIHHHGGISLLHTKPFHPHPYVFLCACVKVVIRGSDRAFHWTVPEQQHHYSFSLCVSVFARCIVVGSSRQQRATFTDHNCLHLLSLSQVIFIRLSCAHCVCHHHLPFFRDLAGGNEWFIRIMCVSVCLYLWGYSRLSILLLLLITI